MAQTANKTINILATLYKHVDDIDLWTGGISEFALPGGVLGPVFSCLVAEQFASVRKGDRFWYENKDWPSEFNVQQLAQIRLSSLARLLCDNSDDIQTIQMFPMLSVDPEINPRIDCKRLPAIDLKKFIESDMVTVKTVTH